jgi:hypothetical protein
MIGRLAVRSLTAHPIRSAVLAVGFGVGVGVMAILLGVAQIVLEQSQAPALAGGGDVVIRLGRQVPARLLLSGTLQGDTLRSRVRVASPAETTALYLIRDSGVTRVRARGGIPSLERALGDEETSQAGAAWTDAPGDVAWTRDTPDRILRDIDRFHPVPDATAWSSSWAEWLYFNGRAADARFYLTFLVGTVTKDGRPAGVRLQLDRGNGVENFAASHTISDAEAMRAPDLTIGANSVRLDGLNYRIALDLRDGKGRRATGALTIAASPGRLLPPLEIAGARGWRSGYVVPVMSGTLDGTIVVDGQTISLSGGTGYHDHNWGYWQGVSWQWGQVQSGDLSLLYGRLFPPREAADPDRIPGFGGALGPDGPLGYASDVTVTETNDDRGQPRMIVVDARSDTLEVRLQFDVGSFVVNPAPTGAALDFFQMRGTYTVSGRASGRTIEFTAPGSAETFRSRTR